MNQSTRWFAAAAVTLGGMGLAGNVPTAHARDAEADVKAPPATDRNAAADVKAADAAVGDAKAASDPKMDDKKVMLNDADLKAIRTFLAETTEAAATPNNLDKLIEMFRKEDRERISADKPKVDTAELDKALGEFQANWKARYKQAFDIDEKDQMAVYSNVTAESIMAGMGRAASGKVKGRPGGLNTDTPGEVQDPGKGKVTGTAADLKGTSDRLGGRDLPPAPNDKSRTVTALPDQLTIEFPASHGLKVVYLPLVREGKSWRIDVPDRLAKGELRNNLLQHINQINGAKDKWPDSANEAAALVTHHLLLAVDDTGVGERPSNAVTGDGKTKEGAGPGR